MKNICLHTLIILLFTLSAVSLVTVKAHAFDELVEELLAGGSCGGSCGSGSCTAGTAQSNCECRGNAATCKCKGSTQCYDTNNVLIDTIPCSGSCKWSKTLPEEFVEFLLELSEPQAGMSGY